MSGHATINRLYRLVWSETLGAWVAVAENTRGRGKRSGRGKLLAALFAGVGAAAMAQAAPPTGIAAPAVVVPGVNQLPTGGKVTGGVVNIAEQGANMTITQATQRGALDWNTFNVGSNAQVNFVQPSASAVTLNRVLDTQASQIYGRITANGQVFLSNPNGVYFSPTASVDVGGLVATTHGIDTADFMAGGSTFQRNGATGSVVNDGTLTAGLGGYIALLAPEVRNNGIIVAQSGTVALAAGEAISLQFDARQALVGVLVTPAQIDTLVENGNAVRAPGGTIIMSAQAAQQLQDGVVRNTGTLEATGFSTQGGKIVLDSSGLVDNSGTVAASSGGSIAIAADRMLSTGALHADQGGSIVSRLGSLVETTGATVSATGGSIAVDTGAGQLYSSGSYNATGLAGQAGGSVTLTGDRVLLMGAQVDASGDAGGGTIRVGGDFQGKNAAVRNATTTSIGTGVTLRADALNNGNGGQVVVWSDETTTFAGAVSAIGGVNGGNGGQLEVSGKQDLHFAGTGDAHAIKGLAGELLLDPKDIYIDADLSGQKEFIDPHPAVGGTFGNISVPLSTKAGTTTTSTGYVLVTNPTDNLGAANSGAAYLFRASDQALISTLYGTHVGDKVGSGTVTALNNGNFVMVSPLWDSGKGAVTWGNGITGWGVTPAAVSASNSLVGSLATFTNSQSAVVSDGQSLSVKLLTNGNYVVTDYGWNDSRGSATFADAGTGVSGVISASNSLVGSTGQSNVSGSYVTYKYGDQIGSSITALANGNYVVAATGWNMGVGAIALGSGTTGLTGVVSATNSLVGSTSRADASGYGSGTDKVGFGLQVLTGSQFITSNYNWNNYAGAITSFDGVTPVTGVVSAANSLVGTGTDQLGSGGISVLASKNAYVIDSPNWHNSLGAVTYVPFATNVKDIAVANSGVVGTTSGDSIGSRSVTVLANQDYVIASPYWNGTRGAATLIDGNTGLTKANQQGTINASNSLVGTVTGDQVASNGVLALTGNGNFIALSPYWSNGGTAGVGAVTWSSGSTPTVGAVSGANSIIGSNANDRIGSYKYGYYQYYDATLYQQEGTSVTVLANGNFAIASPMWNGKRGAITWGSGSTGATSTGFGAVSAANSLVGSNVNDYVGGFMTSVTVTGPTGNNLYYDSISNGITALANGNFVTISDYWSNGAVAKAGAVSWSDGAGNPTVGAVSAANSLVGSVASDMVGLGKSQGNGITLLQSGYDSAGKVTYSGNYVVTNAYWNNGALLDAGAVTWGSGTAPLTGTISSSNSILGQKASDIASWTITGLGSNGNYLVINTGWTNGLNANAGAVSWVDGSSGRLSDYLANGSTNVVSSANSLVGTRVGDRVGSTMDYLRNFDSISAVNELNGNYVVRSTTWSNNGLAGAGAVTWGNGTTGVRGTIDAGNSILGQKAADAFGTTYVSLSNGNYVVANKTADIDGVVNAGAAALVDGTTGHLSDYAARGNQNILSAANSMVGSHAEDRVGSSVYASANYGVRDLAHPGYFIASIAWNCLAGAITYVDDASHPAIGVVGPANSAVGNPNDNFFGGLTSTIKIGLDTTGTAYVTFGGGTGHVLLDSTIMPLAPQILMPNLAAYGEAQAATQAMTPNYVATIMRTGTRLTLQANNDIFIKSGIDATGGTAGGGLTLQAGRSVTVLGSIVTGNRDLRIVANDSVANGVKDAYRNDGIATISMGKNPQGTAATIDAGTGAVDILLAAGSDKTYNKAGSISVNSITASTITVNNQGNGLGTSADLPALGGNCCGYDLGYRGAGADVVLNMGAIMRATGTGTAVTLAAKGKFTNNAGTGAGAIVTTDPAARWLVYANAPGTSTFANLDSGNTAIWNATYTGSAVTQTGNRYVFAYQPTVTVGTQDVTKTYGDDLATGTALADRVLAISGGQSGVAGAFQSDTLATAVSGTATVSSAGAAANAGASATPYGITVDLSGVTGQNGYLVALGSNTPRTLTVNKKTLSASLSAIGKTYDGSTAAVLGASNYVLSGLVNGETFSVAKTSGAFNVAGVAATTVSTTLASSDFVGANGALASNYILPVSVTGVGAIAPKALTVSVSATKTYDGNTSATLSGNSYVLGSFAAGESATVNHAAGVFNSADVAAATTVSATLAGGDFMAGSGTSLANYVLPAAASGTGVINAKALTLGLTGQLGKTYDGTNAAVLASDNYNLGGFVSGQGATITRTAGTYDTASATASTVSVSLNAGDYQAANGTTLSNYVLPTTASHSAAVARAALTVTANNDAKMYDGVAYTGGNGVVVSGLVTGETVANLGGALTYGGAAQGALNVGSYAIAPTGYTSANYTISYVNGALTIIPRPLVAVTANLTGIIDKVYDGSTLATLTNSNFNLSGFVNGDGATVTQTIGAYDSRNAGARTVTATLASNNFAANNGTNLGNYILPTSASGSGTITAKSVTLTAPTVSKVYDGNTSYTATAGNLASLGASLVGGDTVSSAALSFTNRNAGAGNRTVDLTAATVNDGNNGANYVVTLASNSASTITPRVLNVSATGVGRVYDAGTGATVVLSDDRVTGDTLSLADTSAQFTDKNAGASKAINVTGITVSGADSGNYLLASTTAATTATIAKAQLAVSGVTAVARAYDTGTAVALTGAPVVHALGSDVVTVAATGTGQLADKNAGQNKAVTVSGYSITDTNYILVQPTGLTVTINPAVLGLSGLNVVAGKTYDGTRTATLAGTAAVTGLNGEVVSVVGSGSALFANANAGTGKLVTVSGLTASDSNYVIGQQAGLTGTIAQAQLGVAISGVSKVYDGSTTATLASNNYQLTGLVGSESIVVSQAAGLYDSKNAGVRSVSVGLASNNYAGLNGTLLSNYSLPTVATGTGAITAKSVTLTAPTLSKVYDGGLAYTASVADLAALGSNLVGGDTVASAALSFTNRNAGAGNRAVNLSAATVNDGNNGANYVVTLAGNTTSTITPRVLTVSATGVGRVYDAGTNASVVLSDDRVAGDTLGLADTSAQFADKNAGTGKVINVTGISVNGADSGNYTLANTTAATTATIARAQLLLSGVSAVTRAYDTSTAVTMTGTPTVTPLGNDVVAVSGTGTGQLANKNAGQNKAVTVSGYAITDTNYTLVQPTGLTVTINAAVLGLSGLNVVAGKTYDGTRTATLAGTAAVHGLNGETVSVLGTGSALFANANAGTGKAVTVSGFTASDSNYVIGQQAGLTGTIAKAQLGVAISGVTKVYDGSTSATLASSNYNLTGLVGNESIVVSQLTGLYDSKNAGVRSVSVGLASSNYAALNGTLLSNYSLPTIASGAALITPKSVVISAPSVSKVYDGTLAYSTTSADRAAMDAALVAGDHVATADLSFADKNAGIRAVALNAVTLNDGNNGANYSITLAGNTTSTITPRVLNVSATGVGRVYDAGTGATVVLSDDRVAGDTLSLTDTTAQFTDKNAGANKAINVSGISVMGADSGNYTLASTTAGATATIAQAQLAVSGVTAVARAYDTGTTVAMTGTPTVTPLGNDVVTVSATGTGQLADKNAGQGKSVTVSGYSITDTNYVLVQPTGLTVTIDPAVLALGGLNVVVGKTYDGTRTATLAGNATVNGMNGEAVTVLGSGSALFADANAGSGKAVTVSGLVASDSNYVIGQQPGLTGTIAQAQLGVSISGVTKVYDGSTVASVAGNNYNLTGLVGSESIAVSQLTGTFDSKNAGARSVSVNLVGDNFAGVNGTLLSNYSLPTVASGTAVITPKSVVVSAPSVSKTYDGTLAYSTTSADLAAMDAALVAGDHVGTANLSFADKNAGTGRTVSLNTATINDGNNGANYSVTLAGNTGSTITPRVLNVSATGVGRVYDAGTGASVVLSDDRVAGDTLSLADTTAQFTDKNAGANKAINVSGISVMGADSGNYTLASTTAAATATIAQAQLAVSGVTAVARAYDTGTTVAMTGTPTVTPLGNDVVTVSATGTGQLADKNAGQGKSVTVSGYSITDTNYVLVQPTGLTVTIDPAVLALGGLNVVAGKTYDGTRTATLAGNATVHGMNGEAVTVLGSGSALFADANAGSGKAVTVSGLVASDSNYVIGQQPGLTGTIAQAQLGVSISGVTKVYDGSTSASVGSSNYNLTGLVGSESIAVSQLTGTFDSKNAGARSVSVNLVGDNFAGVNGTLLSNYSLPTIASGAALITPKSVVISAPSVSKVYDGTLAYSTTSADLAAMDAALVAGDHVGTANLSFADKNAGTGRTVSLNTATINDGNNGANYSVTLAGSTNATITPRTLQVSATGVNRTYDAGTGASVVLADNRVAGDTLAVADSSAAFTDKNAGSAKTIVVSGLSLAGADSGNYLLASNTINASADIGRADLTVGGVATAARAYDAGTGVTLFGTPTVNALGTDVVQVFGTGVGTLADKNAAQGKQVAVSGYTISDSNYRLIQPVGLTVDIAPAVLALNGLTIGATKTYDGSKSVALTGTASVSGLAGETVTLGGAAIGQFADKNAGSNKTITVTGLIPLDSNYVVGQQAGLVGSIAPAMLVVSGVTGNDKLFDGTVTATLSGTAKVSALAGDSVTVGGVPMATFASADAGIAKAITVSGFALSGADAGNYSVQQPSGLTGTINADAALVPPPVVVVTQALPTPPLTAQLSTQLSTQTATQATTQLSAPAVAGATLLTVPTVALVAPVTTPAGITVALVREPARQESGMVTVSVPKAIAQGAAGFTFPLPAPIVEAAALNHEQVTASTITGGALPSWLSYDNASKTFTASAAPQGSLPFQVLLTIGIEQVVIVVTQNGE